MMFFNFDKKSSDAYVEFQENFKLFASTHPELIKNTLSNIFTMRLIGNKTHGDLAEIGIAEFINQFMNDYNSKHVGKERYRAKEHEEDIVIINELTQEEIYVSLKAYGHGPLQLSTDKEALMFPKLKKYGEDICDKTTISEIFGSDEFSQLDTMNVMPLIYCEDEEICNIMAFNFELLKANTSRILYVDQGYKYNVKLKKIVPGKGRKHPIYMFLDEEGNYICEVRYGGASANALQRGLWTHTKNASQYFNSLINGWISYKPNDTLVKLFRLALNSTVSGHEKANKILQADIDRIRPIH